jgi:hypothetical protein
MNDKSFPWNVKIVFTLPTQPYSTWAPMDPVEEALTEMSVFPEALDLINQIKNKR